MLRAGLLVILSRSSCLFWEDGKIGFYPGRVDFYDGMFWQWLSRLVILWTWIQVLVDNIENDILLLLVGLHVFSISIMDSYFTESIINKHGCSLNTDKTFFCCHIVALFLEYFWNYTQGVLDLCFMWVWYIVEACK